MTPRVIQSIGSRRFLRIAPFLILAFAATACRNESLTRPVPSAASFSIDALYSLGAQVWVERTETEPQDVCYTLYQDSDGLDPVGGACGGEDYDPVVLVGSIFIEAHGDPWDDAFVTIYDEGSGGGGGGCGGGGGGTVGGGGSQENSTNTGSPSSLSPGSHALFDCGGEPEIQSISITLDASILEPVGTTTITVTVDPAVSGVTVELTSRGVANSGGHSHTSADRPSGTFSGAANSGITDSTGSFQRTYYASAFGGSERIRASAQAIADSIDVTVRIAGLQALGAGTHFELVGSTTTHPTNHYGTAGANSGLVAIAAAYAVQYPGSALRYNDQSLVEGGLFDINGDWTTPHAEHRLGRNCDVSKSNVPSSRYATLQQIFTDNGSPNYLSEGNHWHLRF